MKKENDQPYRSLQIKGKVKEENDINAALKPCAMADVMTIRAAVHTR